MTKKQIRQLKSFINKVDAALLRTPSLGDEGMSDEAGSLLEVIAGSLDGIQREIDSAESVKEGEASG